MTLHTVTYGSSSETPLVLLGSLGSSVKMWLPQLDHFSASRQVVAVDLPGHGLSDTVAPSVESFATAILNTLPFEQFDLMGLSLGGALAQHIALNHPDRVRRLVLVSTAPKFGESDAWIQKAADVRAGKLDEFSHGTLERWFSPTWRASHPASYEYWRQMVSGSPAEGYALACEALSGFHNTSLESITVPTLIVAGEQDTSTPPSVVQTLQAIPGSRYEEFSPAAHLLNVERAAEFNALVEEFLG
ncbi:alpha/beta fold hydrolase [Corynebacterium sp. H130]|uniref:alpha/beta fold hydrolase n=1 Tax=Corynebacterium sp. H130 TaxID=3133444 RepID=UPI0030B45C03